MPQMNPINENLPMLKVLPPSQSPFEEIEGLDQLLKQKWKNTKDLKKLEMIDETAADYMMTEEEYKKLFHLKEFDVKKQANFTINKLQ